MFMLTRRRRKSQNSKRISWKKNRVARAGEEEETREEGEVLFCYPHTDPCVYKSRLLPDYLVLKGSCERHVG
jgi:hypothetical protein